MRLQEFKTWDPLYFFAINKDRARFCFFSWVKVHIILSLCCWGLDCRAPGNHFLIVLRQLTVVSSAMLMTLFAGSTVRLSWVSRIYRKELRTHPWGTSVCRIRVEDVCLSNLTVSGLMVGESKLNKQLIKFGHYISVNKGVKGKMKYRKNKEHLDICGKFWKVF